MNEWSDRKLPAPIAMPFKSVKPSKKICAADAMGAVNIYSDSNSKSRRQCKRCPLFLEAHKYASKRENAICNRDRDIGASSIAKTETRADRGNLILYSPA
ncbi:hypothetical protein G5I_00395 [Acromyrmex echinatior]|uniref:Uncharacterized protein n=1 Tax=Acromyrmex echinatior TaxID=103372 RepID=F4W4S0_ACREC|nr:hypothetical protein G5I_00395 [Acromyrmex echinatior]